MVSIAFKFLKKNCIEFLLSAVLKCALLFVQRLLAKSDCYVLIFTNVYFSVCHQILT